LSDEGRTWANPCTSSCEPECRRFNSLGDDIEGSDDSFDFVPMQEEVAHFPPPFAHVGGLSAQEEILVCSKEPGSSPSMRMLVSAELGYSVPRSPASSGRASLSVSTASFCSSQDTVVDADSDYRGQFLKTRAEKMKHFTEQVFSAAPAASTGNDSHIVSPNAICSRPPSQSTKAARPPLWPDDRQAVHHQDLSTVTAVCTGASTPKIQDTCLRSDNAESSAADVARENKYHQDDLRMQPSAVQAAARADAWNDRTAEVLKDRFRTQSYLMSTERYDSTVAHALARIQQYRKTPPKSRNPAFGAFWMI
jgi:hypothetical protein